MKTLQEYMQDEQTAAFNKAGSFFAFGNEQVHEKAQKGVTYVDMGAGLVCPKDTAAELRKSLDDIYERAIKQDLADNGKERVIRRELSNHECFYTGDIEQCVNALADYDVTVEEIYKVYTVELPKWEEAWA